MSALLRLIKPGILPVDKELSTTLRDSLPDETLIAGVSHAPVNSRPEYSQNPHQARVNYSLDHQAVDRQARIVASSTGLSTSCVSTPVSHLTRQSASSPEVLKEGVLGSSPSVAASPPPETPSFPGSPSISSRSSPSSSGRKASSPGSCADVRPSRKQQPQRASNHQHFITDILSHKMDSTGESKSL